MATPFLPTPRQSTPVPRVILRDYYAGTLRDAPRCPECEKRITHDNPEVADGCYDCSPLAWED